MFHIHLKAAARSTRVTAFLSVRRPLAAQLALVGAILGLAGQAHEAQAQDTVPATDARSYDIPAGPLGDVLSRFSSEAGIELVADDALSAGKTSPGLKGSHSVVSGLATLLSGTGLEAVSKGDGSYALRAPVPSAVAPTAGTPEERPSEAKLPTVTVTAAPLVSAAELPEPYAGGQIARGGRLGLLGNTEVMDTPFTVTHYTSKLIADQNARALSDVLANDPSVRIATNRNTIDEKFLIRGINLNTTDIAFNGLYGVSGSRRNTLINVERIEVLKGPNALLNGIAPFGSIGGSINLVPKRATDAPITNLTANYAADSIFGGHIDIGRRFGPDNAFGARANVLFSDGSTTLDRQKEQTKAAALGLDYQGEKLRLSSDFGYTDQENNAQPLQTGISPTIEVVKAPKASRNYQQTWEYQKANHAYATARAEYDILENLTASVALGLARNDEESAYNKFTITGVDGSMSAPHVAFRRIYDTHVAEAGLRTLLNSGPVKHKVSLTFNTYSLKERSRTFLPALNIPSNLYNPVLVDPAPRESFGDLPKAGERNLQSVALADTLSVLDERLQLTLAARYQSLHIEGFDRMTGVRTANYDESTITPSLGLVFKPIQNLALYANYIEGLTQGPTAPAAAMNANEVFPPFKSKQYEVGAKVDLDSFGATLALFQIAQPSAFIDPTTNIFGVDGKQRNRGSEVNVFGEVLNNLRVLGGALILDGTLTDTAGGMNDGNTATGSPKAQFNMGAEWDLGFVPKLTFTGRMIYTTSQQVNAANTQSIPDWSRFDVGARYATSWGGRSLNFRASVYNVLNTNYWESVPFAGTIVLGAPRTLLLSTTLGF